MSGDKNKDQKTQMLDAVMKKIEKDHGKGAIMKMGERANVQIDALPSGCLSLDLAIGIGGLPRGRIIEIYGPESSGKTTLALSAVASCQRLGGTAAFIDAEHALDPVYAKKLGVDIDNLLISQPDHGEQALEIADNLINSGAVSLIVIDSVAALVPKKELEGEMGDSAIGSQARLMSQALRKIAGNASRTGCTVIFINQIRMKIGVMFGSPETTSGGQALKFFASVRIDIRKIKTINQGNEAVGNLVKIKVVKNKVSPPFRIVEVMISFGKGIDRMLEIATLADALGLVEKSGSWYSYKGERIAQGRDNFKNYLEENPKVFEELESEIRKKSKDSSLELSASSPETTEDLEDNEE